MNPIKHPPLLCPRLKNPSKELPFGTKRSAKQKVPGRPTSKLQLPLLCLTTRHQQSTTRSWSLVKLINMVLIREGSPSYTKTKIFGIFLFWSFWFSKTRNQLPTKPFLVFLVLSVFIFQYYSHVICTLLFLFFGIHLILFFNIFFPEVKRMWHMIQFLHVSHLGLYQFKSFGMSKTWTKRSKLQLLGHNCSSNTIIFHVSLYNFIQNKDK